MDIDAMLRNVGITVSGLTVTLGRGKNPVHEYFFVVEGEDSDSVGSRIRLAISETQLRLVSVVYFSAGMFECTLVGLAETRG